MYQELSLSDLSQSSPGLIVEQTPIGNGPVMSGFFEYHEVQAGLFLTRASCTANSALLAPGR